jgi:hypothetical protein
MTFDTTARNRFMTAIMTLYEGATIDIRNSTDTLLCTITVPVAAFAAASGGSVALANPISGNAAAAGQAANYLITLAGGGTETGTVSLSGGGGDMILDVLNISLGQEVNVLTWNNIFPTGT